MKTTIFFFSFFVKVKLICVCEGNVGGGHYKGKNLRNIGAEVEMSWVHAEVGYNSTPLDYN